MRVGLLGGTFNPPHLGHLVCAQEALVELRLDQVLLVPVREPPHKAVEVEPGLEHRVGMCEAAVAGESRLGVSRVDADRPGPSYTADTLRALSGAGDELWFIVGGDMAMSLPAWREPDVVLSLARLAVAEREGVRRDHVRERLGAGAGRVDFFEMPRLDISSSLIRRRVRAGLPIRYLVPDAVAGYIERAGLYRDGGLRPGA